LGLKKIGTQKSWDSRNMGLKNLWGKTKRNKKTINYLSPPIRFSSKYGDWLALLIRLQKIKKCSLVLYARAYNSKLCSYKCTVCSKKRFLHSLLTIFQLQTVASTTHIRTVGTYSTSSTSIGMPSLE